MINVVNKRTHVRTTHDIFVGRGSALGNPWDWKEQTTAPLKCSCRAEAIANYIKYLDEKIAARDPDILFALNSILREARKGDVNLVCYCAPLDCHAGYIKQLVEEKLLPSEPKEGE